MPPGSKRCRLQRPARLNEPTAASKQYRCTVGRSRQHRPRMLTWNRPRPFPAAAYSEYDDEKRAVFESTVRTVPYPALSGARKAHPAEYAAMSEVVFTLCVHWSSHPQFAYARACNGVARQLKLRPRLGVLSLGDHVGSGQTRPKIIEQSPEDQRTTCGKSIWPGANSGATRRPSRSSEHAQFY